MSNILFYKHSSSTGFSVHHRNALMRLNTKGKLNDYSELYSYQLSLNFIIGC